MKLKLFFKQSSNKEIGVSISDTYIGLSFTVVLIFCGLIDKNLFLPDDGKGLFQHYNIWIFILINVFQPLLFIYFYSSSSQNLSKELNLQLQHNLLQDNNFFKVISKLSYSIGFIAFLYTTLQNSEILNHLEFDYWDNIKYTLSYFVSRLYKLYLYSYYLPKIIILVSKMICSINKILDISEDKIKKYPFEGYLELNYLCNMGLNFLLLISVPLLALFSGAYLVHNKLDFTILLGGVLSIVSSLILFYLYCKMIQNYKKSVVKYKNHHLSLINFELANSYDEILKSKSISHNILDRSNYLEQVKQKIESIDSYPLIIKAIATSLLPIFPIIIKILPSIVKYFPQ